MSDYVDKVFFEDLAGKNPEEVRERTSCGYDAGKERYLLSVWGDEYAVYPREARIDRLGGGSDEPHDYLDIFIIHYLLHPDKFEPRDNWISEKDIPGGPTFFRGPHEIPTRLIADRYSGKMEEFGKRCEQLGGVALDMADAAYVFKITPDIPVAVLYWEGDEDFPPEAKLLFDESISGRLALDIIYALAVAVCARVAGRPR